MVCHESLLLALPLSNIDLIFFDILPRINPERERERGRKAKYAFYDRDPLIHRCWGTGQQQIYDDGSSGCPTWMSLRGLQNQPRAFFRCARRHVVKSCPTRCDEIHLRLVRQTLSLTINVTSLSAMIHGILGINANTFERASYFICGLILCAPSRFVGRG